MIIVAAGSFLAGAYIFPQGGSGHEEGSVGPLGEDSGLGDLCSGEECQEYCQEHSEECRAYCDEHPDNALCSEGAESMPGDVEGFGIPGKCEGSECEAYCSEHSEECYQFCQENPDNPMCQVAPGNGGPQ
jgi:hypothetical protein